ncbi:MAG: hypothetical protein ACREOQ_18060 [Gemmatimonadales bacterium]
MKDKLGMIALSTDGHPRGLTPKLDSAGTDPDERFYMLATFCFDLSRKLKYITLALQEFYREAPPEFAKMIRDHERYINPKPDTIPWEEMARRSEQVMKELFAEVQRTGYAEALNELADRAEGAKR